MFPLFGVCLDKLECLSIFLSFFFFFFFVNYVNFKLENRITYMLNSLFPSLCVCACVYNAPVVCQFVFHVFPVHCGSLGQYQHAFKLVSTTKDCGRAQIYGVV